MATKSEDQSVVKHKTLAHAVIAVMSEVKGMEKNSKVGSGNSSYDGTKDQDVKEIFNNALEKNGLCILPTDIIETTQIDRWEEEDPWSKATPKATKWKQSVFTKVNCKYKLLHADSGESQELAGYGHGVDPQDKGAGKATTYALKNALLYAFLTPVGKIDDADKDHSNDIKTPPATKQVPAKQTQPAAVKPEVKTPDPTKLEAAILKTVEGIGKSADLTKLGEAWSKLKPEIKKDKRVVAAKEAKKIELTPKK